MKLNYRFRIIAVIAHFIVSDEEKFMLLSACGGYKQAMHQLEAESKQALPTELEVRMCPVVQYA